MSEMSLIASSMIARVLRAFVAVEIDWETMQLAVVLPPRLVVSTPLIDAVILSSVELERPT